MKKISWLTSLSVLALPFLAAAQTAAVDQKYVVYYRDLIVWVVNSVLVPVLMAIAFFVFLWGVYKYYVYGADNDAERAKGHQFILWGVIGFVVILSVWGIVSMVGDSLNLRFGGSAPAFPKL